MKPDQEKVRDLLVDTVGLLCKNGLVFMKQLKIEGLLGITVDNTDVFIVHIDEVFSGSADLKLNSASSTKDVHHATPARMVPAPVAEYNHVPARPHTVPLRSVPKTGRKHLSSGKSMPVKRERVVWREDAGSTATAAAASDWNEVLDDGMSGRLEHCSPNGADGVYLKSEADRLGKMDDELLWMNAVNDSNNSQCQMDFVSNSAQHFDGANVLDPFEVTSPNESLVAKVTEVSDDRDCGASRKLRQECNSPGMKPDGSSRKQRRLSRRRRSARREMAVPFADSGASILLADSDDGTNWGAEVKGQYSMVTEVDWDNENGLEEDQMQQQEQFGRNEAITGSEDKCRSRQQVAEVGAEQSVQNYRNYSSVDPSFHPLQPRPLASQAAPKPFLCEYEGCSRAFGQKKHLTCHQREKHGRPFGVQHEFSYPCQFRGCQRVFYKIGYLRNHMESEHGYRLTSIPQFAQA